MSGRAISAVTSCTVRGGSDCAIGSGGAFLAPRGVFCYIGVYGRTESDSETRSDLSVKCQGPGASGA
jgi:hypothetical protein